MKNVQQFFSTRDQFARHAGLELLTAAEGYAKVKMDIGNYHLNGVNTVHGGAIFTLADFAFAVASNANGRVAMGVNASISYLKAVTGGTLLAEAREVSLNHKLGHYLVNIYDEHNDLVAVFQGMVYRKQDEWQF